MTGMQPHFRAPLPCSPPLPSACWNRIPDHMLTSAHLGLCSRGPLANSSLMQSQPGPRGNADGRDRLPVASASGRRIVNREPGRLSYREREGRFTCRRENTLRRSNSSHGACVRSRTEDIRGEVSRELPPGRAEGRLGRKRT